MKLFNCNVRLGGNILHSVPKLNITEKELYLLRSIHGDDSIENPKVVGETDIDEHTHLFDLARVYGRERVEKVFHTVLTDFEAWLQNVMDTEEAEREERAKARKAEEEARKAEAAKQAEQSANSNNKAQQTVTME
jgi:hypothetical protein